MTATATAQQVFDNWNTAACGFTDNASLDVDRTSRLARVDLWYHWHLSETSVSYTLTRNGQVIGHGMLNRGSCDPYQEAWCVARARLRVDLTPGTYTFKTARARICQNGGSGGQGFIRAYE